MQNRRKFLTRTLAKVWFYMLLITALTTGIVWLGFHFVVEDFIRFHPHLLTQAQDLSAFEFWFQNHLLGFYLFVIPGAIVFFLLFGFLIWLSMRFSLNKWLPDNVAAPEKPLSGKPAGSDARVQAEAQRRLYLHLFTVLQREGRLMDFLAEDLTLYEDDQIGAAVRTIHQHSKKVVDKYLAPKPVLDQPEGEEFLVPVGFNPAEIKLTGNVTGEPPFNGVLRHKGWRATKLDLPSLSGAQDPKIIAPAEVEIL